jgi:hypothetical protein
MHRRNSDRSLCPACATGPVGFVNTGLHVRQDQKVIAGDEALRAISTFEAPDSHTAVAAQHIKACIARLFTLQDPMITSN